MAVNTSGSLSQSLSEGMTDGKYKKLNRERGGDVEAATALNRAGMTPTTGPAAVADWYGMAVEDALKMRPDGKLR